jgi:hypothetical protein
MATDEGKVPEGGQEPPKEPVEPKGAKAKQKPPKKGGGVPGWAVAVIVIVVIAVIAGIAVGVVMAMSGGEEAENQAPSITSLTAYPDSLAPGEASTVTCVASDPDGDTLSYVWTATGGTVSGTGDTITWIAPPVAKGYMVRVNVSDGNGGTDHDSVPVIVEIVVPTPTPTTVPTPTPTAAPIPSDGSIDIKSNPAGAKVYIDGVDTGSITPYIATHVSEGNHVVKLVYPLYKWRSGAVSVTGGGTEYINWALDAATVQVSTIQPDATDGKDVYVYENIPTQNYETSALTFVSGDGVGDRCRAYLQFDVSAIPSTAVILQANLGLYYISQSGTATAGTVGAYGVTSSWDETTITWDDQPSAAATTLDTYAMPASATSSFLYWDIKALVRYWVDGSVTNYGIALVDTDEASYEGWKGLVTSDSATANQRPKLVIQYYDPAP